ncbi:MAG: carboxyl transferase domain-containing protein, partial [Spirochaetaceae bacterium]|nr:carboxyl transferase domain-containing protein [Spirochaetaceae bacterium]
MGKKRLDSHEFVVLQTKLTQALQGGGIQRIEKQHEKGKLSARERIAELVDSGSFEELDMFRLPETSAFGSEKQSFLGDGVVTGSAKVDGRFVYLYAQDFTVNGGSLSKTHAAKICKVMDMA